MPWVLPLCILIPLLLHPGALPSTGITCFSPQLGGFTNSVQTWDSKNHSTTTEWQYPPGWWGEFPQWNKKLRTFFRVELNCKTTAEYCHEKLIFSYFISRDLREYTVLSQNANSREAPTPDFWPQDDQINQENIPDHVPTKQQQQHYFF